MWRKLLHSHQTPDLGTEHAHNISAFGLAAPMSCMYSASSKLVHRSRQSSPRSMLDKSEPIPSRSIRRISRGSFGFSPVIRTLWARQWLPTACNPVVRKPAPSATLQAMKRLWYCPLPPVALRRSIKIYMSCSTCRLSGISCRSGRIVPSTLTRAHPSLFKFLKSCWYVLFCLTTGAGIVIMTHPFSDIRPLFEEF